MRTSAGSKERRRICFPSLGVLWCPQGPQKKVLKSEGATKMAASSIHCIFTGSRDHLDLRQNALKKKLLTSKAFLKKFFEASSSPEGAPYMAASPIDCICTMPRATARLTAFLQGGRAQGAIIYCKNAVDLFCGRPRARRSQDRTFSPPWRLLGCPKRPTKKALKTRGGHQDGRKLDSLHFYRVPWPRR